MSIITLTTDYGLKDHFVGALKGKIVSLDNQVKIVDISHEVDPFNISEASYVIACAYKNFPKKTVHLIGIDIELKPTNYPIAMEWNEHFFVTSNNGILSLLINKIKPKKMVAISLPEKKSSQIIEIDVLINVAIHLSKGGTLIEVGKELKSLKEVTELQPVIADDANSIKGYIVYIDRFGNAVTNITKEMFINVGKERLYEVNFKSKKIKSIFAKYSDFEVFDKRPLSILSGNAVAIFNESGFLEIGLYKSNPKVASAASLLGITYRDAITIHFS